MQHNLEPGIPVISSKELHNAGEEMSEVVGKGTDVGIQIAETRDEIQQPYKELRRGRRHTQTLWRLSLMIGDGVLLFTVFAFVMVLVSYRHLELQVSRDTVGTWNTRLVCSILALLSWSIAARITQVYNLISASNRFRNILSVLTAITLALFLWIVLTSPFFAQDIGSFVKIVLLYFLVAIPILSFWRVVFAEIMNLPRFRHRAVIVGTTPAGKMLAKEIHAAKRPYTTIVGYISEKADAHLHMEGLPILGGKEVLRRLVNSGMIDMIIMAIDYHIYPELFQEAIEMAQRGISPIPMAIAYENVSGKIPVEYIEDQWYLALPLKVVVSPLYLCWRKVIDIAFGLLGTTLLLLFLPMVAALICLDSPGPIFYRQERLGLRGKPFRLYKFRSMHTDAEQAGQAVWATVGDPRITRVGRFMRATHLDELPQVLNILRGEMSLLGPRPEREEFTIGLEKTIPFYRCRLAIKPGLTGWAQVKYHYARTEDDALIKLQYDLYYIKHQSFMLDIFIILKTAIEVLLHHGT